MNKYINYLLFGFLLFIIGLIIVNFDLKGYKYVKYLPDDYETTTDVISLELNGNKKYKVKKAKNQQNIIIEKKQINTKSNEVSIEIKHTNTSNAFYVKEENGKKTIVLVDYKTDGLSMKEPNESKLTKGLIDSYGDNVNITLFNESKISSKEDMVNIYDLFVRCIKDKTIYNYNLLKYSKVTIVGSDEALSKIEVVDYAL